MPLVRISSSQGTISRQCARSTTHVKVHGTLDTRGSRYSLGTGHRPDLSTLSGREAFRSKNNASGLGIGDPGPLGRLLVRGEEGHDTIPELYPVFGEPVIDKPGRGKRHLPGSHGWMDGLMR